jgi:hypothetical protein
MATYTKFPPPKKVAQDTSKFTCWAAALESWIGAAKPSTPLASMVTTQKGLLAAYKDVMDANNGLVVAKALRQILVDYQMMVDVYLPAGKAGAAPKKAVTGAAVLQRLKMKGYLWMFYIGGLGLSSIVGHAEVIYGITKSDRADAELQVMDPWTGTLTTKPIADLNQSDTVFICWYETGLTWRNDMLRVWRAIGK